MLAWSWPSGRSEEPGPAAPLPGVGGSSETTRTSTRTSASQSRRFAKGRRPSRRLVPFSSGANDCDGSAGAADSRAPLRLALDLFERLGSKPLAERARRELEATGESSRAPEAGLRGELTPQELRIGLRVAAGRTNPEVAGELFMSRKTVERHLSQIYRKLGVRSRTELARVLAPILPEHPSTFELAPAVSD